MRASRETERLLRIVSTRATGVLHSLLRSSSKFGESYLLAWENSQDEIDLEAKTAGLLSEAAEQLGFVLSVAHRVPRLFGSVLWVELPDWLIRGRTVCFSKTRGF